MNHNSVSIQVLWYYLNRKIFNPSPKKKKICMEKFDKYDIDIFQCKINE